MKLLSKLNAILMIFSLGVCLCVDTSLEKRRGEMDIYTANDKLLNQIEKQSNLNYGISTTKQENTFLVKSETVVDKSKLSKPNVKTVKTSGKQKLKFIHINNPLMVKNNQYIDYKQCEVKQGFLEIVNKESSNEIELGPIRIHLDLQKLSLYTTMNENSLFYTLDLQEIQKISQTLKFIGTSCFDVIKNKADMTKRHLNVGRVTLCAKDSNEMNEWIGTVLKFKQCLLKGRDTLSKSMVDFHHVNKLIKKEIDQPDNLAGLWYDNTKSLAYSGEDGTKTGLIGRANETIIKKAFTDLLKTIKISQIHENVVTRQLNDKLRETRQINKELEKKSEIIKKTTEKRCNKQTNLENRLKSIKNQGKEVNLIRAMTERIKKIRTDEMQKVKKSVEKKINEEKEKAALTANKIMNNMIKQSRKMPYSRCIDPDLKYFINKLHIRSLCMELFGENQYKECEEQNKFCTMCCKFHVGAKWFEIQSKCIGQCNELISSNSKVQITQSNTKIEQSPKKTLTKPTVEVAKKIKKENNAIYG